MTGRPISEDETEPPNFLTKIVESIYSITDGGSPVVYELRIKKRASSESIVEHNSKKE